MDESKVMFGTEILSSSEVNELENRFEEEIKLHDNLKPERIYHILYSYYVLKKMITENGTSAKITYGIAKNGGTTGAVSVIGKELPFYNIEQFLKVVELATNFEVYPRTNGTVQMIFGFHGLKKDM